MYPFDYWLLLEQLETPFQVANVYRRTGREFDAAAVIPVAQPAVSGYIHLGQLALDNREGHRTVGHGLIRQDCARVDISVLDVVQGQLAANLLQVFVIQFSIQVGLGDAGQIGIGIGLVPKYADMLDEDADGGTQLNLSVGRPFLIGFGRRGDFRFRDFHLVFLNKRFGAVTRP